MKQTLEQMPPALIAALVAVTFLLVFALAAWMEIRQRRREAAAERAWLALANEVISETKIVEIPRVTHGRGVITVLEEGPEPPSLDLPSTEQPERKAGVQQGAKCGVCGRPLRQHRSVALGFGPVCGKRVEELTARDT